VSGIYHFKVDQHRAEGYDEEQSYMIVNSEYLKLYDEGERKLYTWHEVTKSSGTIKELTNAVTKNSNLNGELSDLRQIAQVTGLGRIQKGLKADASYFLRWRRQEKVCTKL